jgi:hypothetical protein
MNIVPPSDPYAADYNGPLCYMTQDSLLAQCRDAIDWGLEFAKECLEVHDLVEGRKTRMNRTKAEAIEAEIRRMEEAIKAIDNLRDPYGLGVDK